jgi:hypothetical protein
MTVPRTFTVILSNHAEKSDGYAGDKRKKIEMLSLAAGRFRV